MKQKLRELDVKVGQAGQVEQAGQEGQAEKRKVSPRKKKELQALLKQFETYGVMMVSSVENLPSSQFQKIRKKLRGEAIIRMTKRRVLLKMLETVESPKKLKSRKESGESEGQGKNAIEELKKRIEGSCAVIFSDLDVFKLVKLLQESTEKRKARAGQKLKEDIVIEAVQTSLMPGPIITELGEAGIKTGIGGGKISIKERKVFEAGSEVNEAAAVAFSRLNIEPITVGLMPIAAYDRQTRIFYSAETLVLDVEKTLLDLQNVSLVAKSLSVELMYFVGDNISFFLEQAFIGACLLSRKAGVITRETLPDMFGEAMLQAESLSSMIKPVEEPVKKPAEKPVEDSSEMEQDKKETESKQSKNKKV